jgi:hypothetical protein
MDPDTHQSEKEDPESAFKSKLRSLRGSKWGREGQWTLTLEA